MKWTKNELTLGYNARGAAGRNYGVYPRTIQGGWLRWDCYVDGIEVPGSGWDRKKLEAMARCENYEMRLQGATKERS